MAASFWVSNALMSLSTTLLTIRRRQREPRRLDPPRTNALRLAEFRLFLSAVALPLHRQYRHPVDLTARGFAYQLRMFSLASGFCSYPYLGRHDSDRALQHPRSPIHPRR